MSETQDITTEESGAKISKAKLLKLLPVGTKLTLVYTTLTGHCRKHRTVTKADASRIAFSQDDKPGMTEESFLFFMAGDKFFQLSGGAAVENASGIGAVYEFGHV